MDNYKQKTQRAYKALENTHQKNLRRTQSQFFDIKKMLDNIKIDDNLERQIKEKEKKLKELESEDYNYDNNYEYDRETLYDEYMKNKSRKIDKEMSLKKKEIDQKYKFQKPKLEMEENEKEEMEKYIKEIKRLKTYQNNPNFDDVMDTFSLKNYI